MRLSLLYANTASSNLEHEVSVPCFCSGYNFLTVVPLNMETMSTLVDFLPQLVSATVYKFNYRMYKVM